MVFFGGEDAGFTVDASDSNPIRSAVWLSVDNGSEVTISHTTLTGADHGIYSETAFTIANGSTVVIEHNDITGNSNSGIYMGWIDDSIVTIEHNTITNNGAVGLDTGIHIDYITDSDVSIEHNTITDNYGAGIHIGGIGQALRTVTIAHNTITGHDKEGIRVGSITESTLIILGNVISDNETGIGIDDIQSSAVDVSFNNVSGNTGFGIFVNASDEPAWATHNWWGHSSGPFHDVHNSGGTGDEVSDNVTFTPWLGAALTDQPTGCTAHRATGVDAAAETDNVSAQATGGDETTTVTVAEYVDNPTGVAGFAINGLIFVDVHVSGTLPVEMVVEINCPGGDCSETVMRWFDGDVWQDVVPQEIVNGIIRATLNNEDSSPLLSELTGTPFGTGNPIALPEPTTPMVGGEAFSANKLALLAPWLAIFGAIGAGAAIAVRRRRVHS